MLSTKYYSGDPTKKNIRGRWGMEHGREIGEVYIRLWWESLRGQLERPKRRWEANIKIGLQEVKWGYGLDLRGT